MVMAIRAILAELNIRNIRLITPNTVVVVVGKDKIRAAAIFLSRVGYSVVANGNEKLIVRR